MKFIPHNRAELSLHPQASLYWQYDNIPSSMAALQQWRLCYPPGAVDPDTHKPISTLKRPINGPIISHNSQGFTLLQCSTAIQADTPLLQHFGLCLVKNTPLIGIDVDNLPQHFTEDDLPPNILLLLKTVPTYVEISPSGQGLHIWYFLSQDKSQLKKIGHEAVSKNVRDFSGAVYFYNSFLTCTGHKFHLSSTDVANISEDYLLVYVLNPSNIIPHPTLTTLQPATNQTAQLQSPTQPDFTFDDLRRWLFLIPPSISYHTLRDLYYREYRTFAPPIEQPSDYDHWRICAAALHFGAAQLGRVIDAATLFDEWSALDQHNYEGPEATLKKFYENPPKYNGKDITHKTLIKLANVLRPQWSYPKPKATSYPIETNLENWKRLAKHHGIRLRQNEITKEIDVVGSEQIVKRWFSNMHECTETAITMNVLVWAQNNGFVTTTERTAQSFVKYWLNADTEHYNPIKDWIEKERAAMPYNKQVEGSYFERLWNTLTLQPCDNIMARQYKTYLKKNLMGVIRAHWYTGDYSATSGVVILSGAENTRKSTWIRQLLPKYLRDKYLIGSMSQLSREANVKELQLEAGVCQIWLKDEIEGFLKAGDALLKNFLTQETDSYRPLFGKRPINVPRKCIFFGTTNLSELPITDEGSRRIQIIPIEYCDTDKQTEIPMARLFLELLEEFENTPDKDKPFLWALTPEEIEQTNQMNFDNRLDQDIDIYLKEYWAFDQPYDEQKANQYVTPIKNIITELRNNGLSVKPTMLKHALKRQCGNWTQTYNKVALHGQHGKARVQDGLAKYFKADGKVSKQGWLMPPLRSLLDTTNLDSEVIS